MTKNHFLFYFIFFSNLFFARGLNADQIKFDDERHYLMQIDAIKVKNDIEINDFELRRKDLENRLVACDSNFDDVFFSNLNEFERMANDKILIKNGGYSLSKLIELLAFFEQFTNLRDWSDRTFQYQADPPFEKFPFVKNELLNWYFKNRFLPCLDAKVLST